MNKKCALKFRPAAENNYDNHLIYHVFSGTLPLAAKWGILHQHTCTVKPFPGSISQRSHYFI